MSTEAILPLWALERAHTLSQQAPHLSQPTLKKILAYELTLAFEKGVGVGIDRLADNLKATK